jgi:hypothetical protein
MYPVCVDSAGMQIMRVSPQGRFPLFRVETMRAARAALLLVVCCALIHLPAGAEMVYFQTTPDNVFITLSSATGTVASGTSAPVPVHGGSWFQADLPPGTYSVRGERVGYVTQTTTVTVMSGWSPTVTLNLPVAPAATGRIVISTNVCDAEIGYSDSTKETMGFGTTRAMYAGAVPCYYSISVPAGTYEISAGKRGYETQHQTVSVPADGEVPVGFTLTGPAATVTTTVIPAESRYLTLEVSPSPCTVKVCVLRPADEATLTDARTSCQDYAPWINMDLQLPTGRTIVVTVSKPGYVTQTVKTQLPPGEDGYLRVQLKSEEIEFFPTPTAPGILSSTRTLRPVPTLTYVEPAPTPIPTLRHGGRLSPSPEGVGTDTTPAPGETPEIITPTPTPSDGVMGGLFRFFAELFGGR